MGRRSHAKSLNLWMNGLPVGTWETTRDGEKLTYFEAWIEDEQGRPLSLSLPFTAGNQPYRGKVVSDYFDNLLPDSRAIRERIAGRYKLAARRRLSCWPSLDETA
jgi:serine/threonine-protein kinase HipA